MSLLSDDALLVGDGENKRTFDWSEDVDALVPDSPLALAAESRGPRDGVESALIRMALPFPINRPYSPSFLGCGMNDFFTVFLGEFSTPIGGVFRLSLYLLNSNLEVESRGGVFRGSHRRVYSNLFGLSDPEFFLCSNMPKLDDSSGGGVFLLSPNLKSIFPESLDVFLASPNLVYSNFDWVGGRGGVVFVII